MALLASKPTQISPPLPFLKKGNFILCHLFREAGLDFPNEIWSLWSLSNTALVCFLVLITFYNYCWLYFFLGLFLWLPRKVHRHRGLDSRALCGAWHHFQGPFSGVLQDPLAALTAVCPSTTEPDGVITVVSIKQDGHSALLSPFSLESCTR